MRLIPRLVLLFTVAAVATYSTSGQTPDTLINADIRICNSFFAHRPALMFVHLDKQIYNPDENISFTAYTLDAIGDSVPTTTLHVVLIDPANGKEVANEQTKMESGFSTGTLPVPDTVGNGPYIFIAYTNTMVHQSNFQPFRQTITIKATSRDPFQIVNASVIRMQSKPDSVFWHARIITDSNGLASKGIFEFTIRSGRKVALSGKRLIDAFGEVDLGLPAQDTLLQGMIITAKVTRGKKSCKLSKTIDLTPQRINVGYFPEGGKLIHRLGSRMVVCFSRNDGSAVHTTGSLYSDTDEVAHFQTDLYGFASFNCLPDTGKRYWIHLDQMPPDSYLAGKFPGISTEGLALRIPNGVVRDSITIEVHTSKPGGEYPILIYSASKVIYAGAILLKKRDWGIIKLASADWPNGMARVLILSKENVAVAERTIYISPTPLKVNIETDSSEYHHRSKVNVSVKVTTVDGVPVRGLLSFASTMAARVHPGSFPDITRPFLFSPFLHYPSVLPPADYFRNDTALDLVLLGKMGDYLHWSSLVNDTDRWLAPRKYDNYGYVLRNDRKLKKPIGLSIMGPRVFSLTTDSAGRFEVPDSMLIMPFGNDAGVVVAGGSSQGEYQLILQNRYDSVAQTLASTTFPAIFLKPGNELPETTETTSPFNSAKMLKAAVVKAVEDEDVPIGSGECRDWVCLNNILNCMNHRVGTKPKIGGVYKYGRSKNADGTIVYNHCMTCRGCFVDKPTTFVSVVKGIHLPGDFYNMDSVKFSPTEPATYSTLYWAPIIMTDSNGQAKFVFYTNDVSGRFYNILQGWSPGNSFKGQAIFTVIQ